MRIFHEAWLRHAAHCPVGVTATEFRAGASRLAALPSLRYTQYPHSSRLASRAPRSGTSATYHVDRTLAAADEVHDLDFVAFGDHGRVVGGALDDDLLRSMATRLPSISSWARSALRVSGSARSCESPFSLMVMGVLSQVYSHTDLAARRRACAEPSAVTCAGSGRSGRAGAAAAAARARS